MPFPSNRIGHGQLAGGKVSLEGEGEVFSQPQNREKKNPEFYS